jgi:hypothetical protein
VDAKTQKGQIKKMRGKYTGGDWIQYWLDSIFKHFL